MELPGTPDTKQLKLLEAWLVGLPGTPDANRLEVLEACLMGFPNLKKMVLDAN